MIDTIYQISSGIICLAVIMAVVRALKGPSAFDRVMAVDTVALGIVGLLMTESVASRDLTYFDAALSLALCSFIGTAFLGHFLGEGQLGD